LTASTYMISEKGSFRYSPQCLINKKSCMDKDSRCFNNLVRRQLSPGIASVIAIVDQPGLCYLNFQSGNRKIFNLKKIIYAAISGRNTQSAWCADRKRMENIFWKASPISFLLICEYHYKVRFKWIILTAQLRRRKKRQKNIFFSWLPLTFKVNLLVIVPEKEVSPIPPEECHKQTII